MSASSSSQLRRRPTAASAGLLWVVVISMLVIGSPAEAQGRAHITFAGLKAATTCIPGPIGAGRTSSYHLSWEPATKKNKHPRFVYEIYQATMRGGENFSHRRYATAPGVTSFDTHSSQRKTPSTSSSGREIEQATKTRTSSSKKARTSACDSAAHPMGVKPTMQPVDDAIDQVRGAGIGPVIVEYGDYECPSRKAFREIEQVRRRLGGGNVSMSSGISR